MVSNEGVPKIGYHCTVVLNDDEFMLIGSQPVQKNYIYNKNSKTYTEAPNLNHRNRGTHACAVFNSWMHDSRPVVVVMGGGSFMTVELLDYTQENAQWTLSNYIMRTNLLNLYNLLIFSKFVNIN